MQLGMEHSLADGLEECELDGAALERQGEDTWAVESGGSRVRTHQKRAKKGENVSF